MSYSFSCTIKELTVAYNVLYSPNDGELKIVSSKLLHIADRSFYLGPFANQRDLDAGADTTGRHPAEHRSAFLIQLLNDHDTPAKGLVSSARQQLETLWPQWVRGRYGTEDTESDAEHSLGAHGLTGSAQNSSSGRCATPPP